MPSKCIVDGCESTSGLFRFPMISSKNALHGISMRRQMAWRVALRLDERHIHESRYAHLRVCALHFVGGRSMEISAEHHVDWCPSINLGYETHATAQIGGEPDDQHNDPIDVTAQNEHAVQYTEEPRQSGHRSAEPIDLAAYNVYDMPYEEQAYSEYEAVEYEHEGAGASGYQAATPIVQNQYRNWSESAVPAAAGQQTSAGVHPTTSLVRDYYNEITVLKAEHAEREKKLNEDIKTLQQRLSRYKISLEQFVGDDDRVRFYTGLSSYVHLKALFDKLERDLPSCPPKLSRFQVLVLTLSRLRLNMSFTHLAYDHEVSIQTISKMFYSCLAVLYMKLRTLIYWPKREDLKVAMSKAFQTSFGDKITVIVDCFEIFIEKPADLKAAVACWSNYNHAYTVKYMIGITPQGFVCFISPGYGGRCSDTHITRDSKFIENLMDGDVVMADRGFLIQEDLNKVNASLQIPAFTKGKQQLDPLDVEKTRKIANVRIHVERAIGQLREKYTILNQRKFPVSVLAKQSNQCDVPVVDQIVTACCALVNMCRPIVPLGTTQEEDEHEFMEE